MGEGLEGVPMSRERMLEIPVSIVPTEAIRAMRIIGESRGWEMSRFQDSTLVHRWAIIVPIAKRAWSYVPGSSGRLSFVTFRIPEEFNEDWEEFLNQWTTKLPRCPWRWTFIERSIIGYLLPEFRKSRKIFSKEGMDIGDWKGLQD